jgi:hypothetical protein
MRLAPHPLVFALLLCAPPQLARGGDPPSPASAVRPAAERSIYIPEFEYSSSSEFGTRIGGVDNRKFAFTADGKKLIGHDAGMWHLEVWDAVNGSSEGRFGRLNGDGMIAPHPTKPLAVTVECDRFNGNCPVALWDTAKQKKVSDLDEGVNRSSFVAGAVAPDGRTIWLWEHQQFGANLAPRRPGQPAAAGPAIKVWDVETGDEVRSLPSPALVADHLDQSGTQLLAFAPSGKWVAAVAGRRVLVLEAATGKVRAELGRIPAPANTGTNRGRRGSSTCGLAVSGNGRQVLVGCADGVVRRWDVTSGRELPPLVGHTGRVRAVWCSPDGKQAKSMSDDKVLEWDLPAADTGWLPPRNAPTADQLTALVDRLTGDDPAQRYAAMETLVAHPAKVAELVGARVKPVAQVDRAKLDSLVKDLNGPDYNTRKRAARELREIGEPALVVLAEPNASFDSFGLKLALEIREKARTPEFLRAARCVEFLERLNTPEAHKVLTGLAAGAEGASLTIIAREAGERAKARKVIEAPPAEPARLWEELRSEDASKAFRAILALASQPAESTRLLRTNLLACECRNALNPARVEALIAGLGADDFQEREKASKTLAGYGRAAEPALKAAQQKTDNPEIQRRLTDLLRAPADPSLTPDAVQVHRAVEVLELIGTPDARAALEAAAEGAKTEWFLAVVSQAAGRIRK